MPAALTLCGFVRMKWNNVCEVLGRFTVGTRKHAGLDAVILVSL